MSRTVTPILGQNQLFCGPVRSKRVKRGGRAQAIRTDRIALYASADQNCTTGKILKSADVR
jgi:hypothetical protein